ncbi:hypothetical protein C8R45DRAFT_942514 [Mycena sanguinolenta]|nr:hypothetical protein C8R45DRAFT_942514 [Mycena sanguinolenta]
MSDEHIVFHCLGHTNYAEWALQVEAILIRKGLWNSCIEILVNKNKSDGNPKTPAEISAEQSALISACNATKMAEPTTQSLWRHVHGLPGSNAPAQQKVCKQYLLDCQKLCGVENSY